MSVLENAIFKFSYILLLMFAEYKGFNANQDHRIVWNVEDRKYEIN